MEAMSAAPFVAAPHAAAHHWAFHAHHAFSDEQTAHLHLTSWASEDWLSDAGTWRATQAPGPPDEEQAVLDATPPGASTIIPFRDGDPLFTGWIGAGSRDGYNLAGGGLLSYYDTRFIITTLGFAAVDQHDMFAELIEHTQDDDEFEGLNVDTSMIEPSGVLRDQTWNHWEGKNVGEAIRQKSRIIGGFDFDIRAEMEAMGIAGEIMPVRRARAWTPRRGVSVAQGGPVFRYGQGGNLIVPPKRTTNPNYRNTVIALGAEINSTTRERRYSRRVKVPPVGSTEPVAETVLSLNEVSTQSVLDAHCEGWLAATSRDPDLLVLTVNPDDATWPWRSWDLGSDCMVVVEPGTPQWPMGAELERRIVAHIWGYGSTGEVLQVATGRIP